MCVAYKNKKSNGYCRPRLCSDLPARKHMYLLQYHHVNMYTARRTNTVPLTVRSLTDRLPRHSLTDTRLPVRTYVAQQIRCTRLPVRTRYSSLTDRLSVRGRTDGIATPAGGCAGVRLPAGVLDLYARHLFSALCR